MVGIEELHGKVATLESQLEVLTQALEAERREKRDLQHYIDYLRRRVFGPRGEKLDASQLKIPFEDLVEVIEAERPHAPLLEATEAPDGESDEDRIAKRHRRKAGAHGRTPLPEELPRVRIEHDVEEGDRCCPSCTKEMSRIGEVVTEEVDYVPASVIVREHVRPKYACRKCQEGVLVAQAPKRVIQKGRPGPGLLAQVLVSKYSDHLPLHRQEAIFERHGYSVSRSTLCDWVGVCAEKLFPIVKLMRTRIVASSYVHADETPVLMQTNSRGGGKQRAWLWVYVNEKDEVVYDFRTSRGRDGPMDFLDGFAGYLQVDDYAGYNEVCRRNDVTKVACWAHARRGFFEALASATADASMVLAKIQRLYRVEKEARDGSMKPSAVRGLRRARSGPILASIRQDLDRLSKSALPKSALGKAVAYTLALWAELTHYVDDGNLAIDNNSAERAMRGVAVGRKNWLFCGGESGGQRAAVIYSLIETCKRARVEPFEYLRDVLERIGESASEDLLELTPQGWRDARAEKIAAAVRG